MKINPVSNYNMTFKAQFKENKAFNELLSQGSDKQVFQLQEDLQVLLKDNLYTPLEFSLKRVTDENGNHVTPHIMNKKNKKEVYGKPFISWKETGNKTEYANNKSAGFDLIHELANPYSVENKELFGEKPLPKKEAVADKIKWAYLLHDLPH